MRTAEIKSAFEQAAIKAASATGKERIRAEKQKAIIHNLYHDDRISPERASKFLAGLIPGWDSEDLLDRLEEYHETCVRRWSNPRARDFSFNGREENGLNLLPRDALAGSDLGSVFNLSNHNLAPLLSKVVRGCGGLLPRDPRLNEQLEIQIHELFEQMDLQERQQVESAIQLIQPILLLINDEKQKRPYDSVISAELKSASEAQRGAIAAAILRLIALHNNIVPFEPTWAFCWEELNELTQRYLRAELHEVPAEEWCESIAIKAKAGDWLVLLKYPSDRPSMIVRPTQLDAGVHEFHFPSPIPDQPRGGHPVWVTDSVANKRTHLIREVIHQSVRFSEDDIIAVTQLRRDTPSANPDNLIGWRQNHWSALQEGYGDIKHWMSDPNVIADRP